LESGNTTKIMAEYKIFVGGLAYGATDNDLYDLFDKYGLVKDAKVCMDRESGRSKGFGFVEYENYEDMNAALKGADGVEIRGRAIICEKAKSKSGGGGRDGGSRGDRDGGRDRYGGGGGRDGRDRDSRRDRDSPDGRRRSDDRYNSRDSDRRDRSGDRRR